MKKDFWRSSTVAVLGGGSWGTVLANLAAKNCADVRIWVRDEDRAREINATRANPDYVPEMALDGKVKAISDLKRVFEGPVHAVIWAVPSGATRGLARDVASLFHGDEILLHATKGIEHGTLKRMSAVLAEELPCPRIGVISGPNLATEIARGEPAATIVASRFAEVLEAGGSLLQAPSFRVYGCDDVIGVEWAGVLKNILAIASGCIGALELGWNARAMLISRGLAEMVRFGVALGARESTFLGLAGVGDVIATCSSPLSRNYRVGYRLAKGVPIRTILDELESTAEGVPTTESVWEFARAEGIDMPITEGVYRVIKGEISVKDVLSLLMVRPAAEGGPV